MTKRRVIGMSVLPGQPTDGSGVVCIHLFVPDERGPFVEPHVIQVDKVAADSGRPVLVAGPKRGRLACNPKSLVAAVERRGVTTITMRTDDPRAVTCPKCIASTFYTDIMQKLTGGG